MSTFFAAYVPGKGNQPSGYSLQERFGEKANQINYVGFLEAPVNPVGIHKGNLPAADLAVRQEKAQKVAAVVNKTLDEFEATGTIAPETRAEYDALLIN